MVIKAIGQTKQTGFLEAIGIEFDDQGRVLVDENLQTSIPTMYSGGDCVNGGAEAVDAAQAGKLAAMGIHSQLTGEEIVFAGARI